MVRPLSRRPIVCGVETTVRLGKVWFANTRPVAQPVAFVVECATGSRMLRALVLLRRVLVRAAAENGRWRLSIEDDGRGFPFVGLRSHAELDALGQGPRMIGERVRMIGGEMIVESRPRLGARVEVAIPLQPQS
jgi:hypothetical protein